jgi:putative hydrolase of the HAD superfamily
VEPALSAVLVVLGCAAAAVAAGLAYLWRVRVERPPVGVYNGRDVAITTTMLVVLPPLYLHLPRAVVAVVLGLVSTSVVYATVRPALPGRAVAAALTLSLAAAAVVLAVAGGGTDGRSSAFLAVNDAVLVVMVVGACNMWVQSGLRARQVAAFAAVLAGYDVVATAALPVMLEFFERVAVLPFAPALGWGHGSQGMVLGLGDLVLVVLWALVVEKSFGRAAGVAAGLLGVAGVAAIFLAAWADLVNRAVPAMVVLGPLMVAHHALLARRHGAERTTQHYLAALDGTPPPADPVALPSADVRAALARAAPRGVTGPVWFLAVRDGEVVGEGATAGAAVRAARGSGGDRPPLLVRVPRERPETAAGRHRPDRTPARTAGIRWGTREIAGSLPDVGGLHVRAGEVGDGGRVRRTGQVLVFDADDTLWEYNVRFERAVDEFLDWLAHPTLHRAAIRAVLDDIEAANAVAHGYGTKVFLRSLHDCVERLRERPATDGERREIEALVTAVLDHRVEPAPGVAETLADLAGRHDLLLLTKGDPAEQQRKIDFSGLGRFFGAVHIVPEKDVQTYHRLVREHALAPETTWMVGNSPRSDILPARAAGLNAVFIPNDNTWVLEHAALDPGDPGVLTLRAFPDLLHHF